MRTLDAQGLAELLTARIALIRQAVPALQALARMQAAMDDAARIAATAAQQCKPTPRRDRPAWQSTHGPPQRRRNPRQDRRHNSDRSNHQ